MADLGTAIATALVSVFGAIGTAYLTTQLKFAAERKKDAEDWRSKILEKYYDKSENFQKLAQQFAIGVIFFEDKARPGHHEKVFVPRNFNLTIGRLPSNDIVSHDIAVSRMHALVTSDERNVSIEDLFTTNPTSVNGEMLQGRRQLADGDIMLIGQTEFRFKAVGGWLS